MACVFELNVSRLKQWSKNNGQFFTACNKFSQITMSVEAPAAITGMSDTLMFQSCLYFNYVVDIYSKCWVTVYHFRSFARERNNFIQQRIFMCGIT